MDLNFKKIATKTTILLGIIAISISCERMRVIPYDIPYEGDQLVLLAFISLDEGVRAYVSHTLAPNNRVAESKVINDAFVELYEDDILVDTLKYNGADLYISDPQLALSLDSRYRIIVKASGYDIVESHEVQLLESVILEDVYIESVTDSGTIQVNYSFQDEKEKSSNRYQVKLSKYSEQGHLLHPKVDYFFSPPLTFLDTGFDGGIYSSFESSYRNYKDQDSDEYVDVDKLELEVIKFSEEFNTYIESLINYEGTSFSPWGEPWPVYDNLDGGVGAFASYSLARNLIEL